MAMLNREKKKMLYNLGDCFYWLNVLHKGASYCKGEHQLLPSVRWSNKLSELVLLVELFHWSEEHFFNQVQFHKVKSWTKMMFTYHIYFVNKVSEMAGEHTSPVIVTLKLYLDLLSGSCSEVSQSCTPYLSESQPYLTYEHGVPCIEATEQEAGLHFSAFLCAIFYYVIQRLVYYISHAGTEKFFQMPTIHNLRKIQGYRSLRFSMKIMFPYRIPFKEKTCQKSAWLVLYSCFFHK